MRIARTMALAVFTLIVAVAPAFADGPEWFHGTGVESAYDKELAHDLAFRAAVAAAAKDCGGSLAGPVEEKTTYQSLASGEWQVTVVVRAMCQGMGSMP